MQSLPKKFFLTGKNAGNALLTSRSQFILSLNFKFYKNVQLAFAIFHLIYCFGKAILRIKYCVGKFIISLIKCFCQKVHYDKSSLLECILIPVSDITVLEQ